MLVYYLTALDTVSDQKKMAEIYEEYEPIMLRYAIKITKSKEMAEDAVHNAFLAIIKHKEKYFSLSCRDLSTQIVIITKNKCIDLLRSQNRFVADQIDDMEDLLIANDSPIEDQIILSDEYEFILEQVASLDEVSRSVLEMKYILGLSYKEIGEQLNMTPKHVDVKIMRAKEKVRKIVAKGERRDGH